MTGVTQEVFKHIRRIEIATTRLADDIMVGAYHSAFKGRGMEFEEVRDYVPGDDVRTIDWNVTARMNDPHIKTYREERELTVMLVVDISASSRFGTGNQTKGELIAEIAAVLAFSAIKNNDKVGLLLFSEDIEEYLPPKKGLRHVLRVIRDLLVFNPKKQGSNLKSALNFLGKVQRKKCVCFLISDFILELCPHEIAVTAKRHDLISICVADDVEHHLPKIGLASLRDLETGEIRIVDTSSFKVMSEVEKNFDGRVAKVKNLMTKTGSGYVFLKTNESYAEPLRQFFSMRRVKY
ncbi:MAG: DUF58 domain-containing protein [Chlamydiota bacterium]|nr:DUF58 domain-containing protein [Chlamydiota bacterium]